MKRFRYARPERLEAALRLLREPGAKALAGGTDLLTELKARTQEPELLVSVQGLQEPGLRGVREDERFVRIGALTTLRELEAHPLVREKLPILAQAAQTVATPQIRHVGTVGGNLMQQVRCWYYRHPFVRCWLKGGEECYAEEGLNHRHAIFGTSPCIAVHPSDLAPALIALDAQARVVGPDVEGELALEELYRLPDERSRARTVLGPADLIVEVLVPKPSEPTRVRGVYLKAMERATWSFAVVSVAARLSFEPGSEGVRARVGDARLVLGGVAGKPWRARDAEAALRGSPLTDEAIERAAEAAVAGAQPRAHNAYKIELTRALVKRALRSLLPP